MKKLNITLATSAFLLVAGWVYMSSGYPALRITGWIGLISTAALFLTGGGAEGFKKSLWTGTVGIAFAAVAILILNAIGDSLINTTIVLASLAFILVAISNLPGMGATAVSFIGACCFIAGGATPDERALFMIWSWVAGLVLGYCVGALAKKFDTLMGSESI